MLTRRQALGVIGATAAASAYWLSINPITKTPLNLQDSKHGFGRFSNAVLTNHHNQKVKFYDDLIKDKFVVINMKYAQCSEGVCPITTMNMRHVQNALGDRIGRDIHMYSITLLPDHDNPKVLNDYAKKHKTGPGWQFLTGKYADIEVIRRSLGFYDVNPIVDADRTQHAGVVRIGHDAYNRWMMAPALGSPETILQVIKHADMASVKA